jgi:hypothetical protein
MEDKNQRVLGQRCNGPPKTMDKENFINATLFFEQLKRQLINMEAK